MQDIPSKHCLKRSQAWGGAQGGPRNSACMSRISKLRAHASASGRHSQGILRLVLWLQLCSKVFPSCALMSSPRLHPYWPDILDH